MASSMKHIEPSSSGRRLLYKVKSTTGVDGSVVYSVFSCIDDIEHQRHRRNPFDPKYIRAALSSFEIAGRDSCKYVATREEVEAASTNIHVRVELIKSMKDGLMKLTTEAVKHCNRAFNKAHKKMKCLEEIRPEVEMVEKSWSSVEADGFSCEDDLRFYNERLAQSSEALQAQKSKTLLGFEGCPTITTVDIGIGQVFAELESHLNEYSSLVSDDELSFNLNKEMLENSQNPSLRSTHLQRCEEVYLEEDGFGDLSPFKKYISPIMNDLIFDIEDPKEEVQSTEIMWDESAQVVDADTGCKDLESTEDMQKQSTEICDADVSCNLEKIEGTPLILEVHPIKGAISSCGVLASVSQSHGLNRTNDISRGGDELMHTNNEASSIVTSLTSDSNMSQHTSQEVKGNLIKQDCSSDELIEIISDEEEIEALSNQEEVQDDIEDRDMVTDIKTCFNIKNEDIEKFIQQRRQQKKGKSLWFVQDPEKLLYPNTVCSNFQDKNLKHTESEDGLQTPFVVKQNMFREALLKSGLDLVHRYEAMQQDPSKIPGALQFFMPEEEKLYDKQAFDEENIFEEVSGAENECLANRLSQQSLCSAPGGPKHGILDSSPFSHSATVTSMNNTEFDLWDNFSWSSEMAQKIFESQSVSSAEDNNKTCERFTDQHIQNNFGQNNKFAKGDEEPIREPVCDVMVNNSMRSTSTLTLKDHEASIFIPESSLHGTNDTAPLINLEIDSTTATINETNGESSVCMNAVLDDPTMIPSFPKSADDKQAYSLSTAEGWAEDWEGPEISSQRKTLVLDELITGAVMVECQMHQKAFGHYDIEPLSKALSTHILTIYKKMNVKKFSFKDLVDACHLDSDLTSSFHKKEISVQRIFIAILYLAHQQNMGSLKESKLNGFQILLETSSSGSLTEMIVCLE